MSALFIVLVILAFCSVRFYIEVSGDIDVIKNEGDLSVVFLGVFIVKIHLNLSKPPSKSAVNLFFALIYEEILNFVDFRSVKTKVFFGVKKNALFTATISATFTAILGGFMEYLRAEKASETYFKVYPKYNENKFIAKYSCIFGIAIADIIYSVISYFVKTVKERRNKDDYRSQRKADRKANG